MSDERIIFCSDFPFGYHNREAEEKMRRFADRGYRVAYVGKLGIRNPSPTQLLDQLRARATQDTEQQPFDVLNPRLVPARRAPLIRPFNERWLQRQLEDLAQPGRRTIIWVRFATPELLRFIERANPALVIYELVDDHARAPGMGSDLRSIYERAEQRILDLSGLAFAWSEPLASRISALFDGPILLSAAAAIEPFARAGRKITPERQLATYVGSVDRRLDLELIAGLARELPDWRFRFVGPIDPSARARLASIDNVELRGPIEPALAPEALAAGSVCLLPYRIDPFSENLLPVKMIESMATGRSIVGTPLRALSDIQELVTTATQPKQLADALRNVRGGGPRAAQRRQWAAAFDWPLRIETMEQEVRAALDH